jgi:hypothetical protein
MRALLPACLAFCCFSLAGCNAVNSAHPLYLSDSADDAVDEPAIVGTWMTAGEDTAQLCIQKGDRNTYGLVVSSPTDRTVDSFSFTLVRLDGQLYADMTFQKELKNGTEFDDPLGAIYHHVILKIDLTETDLSYAALDFSAIQDANQHGNAPLNYIDLDGETLLTSSTEDLRRTISLYGDRLFSEGGQFTREDDNDGDNSLPVPCSADPSQAPDPTNK